MIRVYHNYLELDKDKKYLNIISSKVIDKFNSFWWNTETVF